MQKTNPEGLIFHDNRFYIRPSKQVNKKQGLSLCSFYCFGTDPEVWHFVKGFIYRMKASDPIGSHGLSTVGSAAASCSSFGDKCLRCTTI